MYCRKCGKPILDDDLFCWNCGQKIVTMEERQRTSPPPVSPPLASHFPAPVAVQPKAPPAELNAPVSHPQKTVFECPVQETACPDDENKAQAIYPADWVDIPAGEISSTAGESTSHLSPQAVVVEDYVIEQENVQWNMLQEEPPKPEQPHLKWYYFLIYFSLIIGIPLNVFYGFNYLLGLNYTYQGVNVSYAVYAEFEGLQGLDVCMGLGSLVLAWLSLRARQRLAKFQWDGPRALYTFYVTSIVLSMMYGVFYTLITWGKGDFAQVVIQIGSTAFMQLGFLIGNIVYFHKRRTLFYNE